MVTPLTPGTEQTPLRLVICLLACAIGCLVLGSNCAQTSDPTGGSDTPSTTEKTTVTMITTQGTIVIELFTEQAPQAVANFLKYADEDHYYDGTIIHQVLSGKTGLLAGQYSKDLEERAQKRLVNESNNGLTNTAGRVALYGPKDTDLGRPRILINTATNTQFDFVLDGKNNKVDYTVIGKVVSGLEVVEAITKFSTTSGSSDTGTNLSSIPVTEDGSKVRILTIRSDSTAPADNIAPVANAGEDQTVEPGNTVTLDGSGSSDANDDPLTYQWKLTLESREALNAADLTITLSSATAQKPTFTAPKPDETMPVTFELTVNDDWGATSTDSVTITLSDHASPTAKAGPDQTGRPTETIRFDGSGSAAADTTEELTYLWEITAESRQLLESQGLAVPASGTLENYTFTAPQVSVPTLLKFNLTVTDEEGSTGQDTVQARILPLTFDAPVSYPVSSLADPAPMALAAADFNGDDVPDLAVANSGTQEVAILLCDGSGAFGSPVTYNLGASPQSLVTGDLDGDGDIDVAAITPATNRLRVLLNDGTGSFTLAAEATVGGSATSPVTVNLDSKNNTDIVALNFATNNVSVLLNDGDAEFSFPVTNVSVAAKDEDGNAVATTGAAILAGGTVDSGSSPDLVVVFKTTANAAVWLGNGKGGFTFGSVFDVGDGVATPRDILLTDLDGDSRSDVGIALNTTNVIAIRRGGSDGKFGIEGQFATGNNPSALIAADVDGDGSSDLVVTNQDDNTVSVLLNKGSAAFKARVDLALAAGDSTPADVASGDFDDDGAPDLAVANWDSDTITILLNRTSAAFAPVDANGFTTTRTWLKYKDIVVGTGKKVSPSSTVVVRYTGRLDDENGKLFDTTVGTSAETKGREFSLDSVVKGWKEGLGNYDMRVGGKRQLIIPGDLGYGTTGQSPNIPPNAVLWFEVEILEVK